MSIQICLNFLKFDLAKLFLLKIFCRIFKFIWITDEFEIFYISLPQWNEFNSFSNEFTYIFSK